MFLTGLPSPEVTFAVVSLYIYLISGKLAVEMTTDVKTQPEPKCTTNLRLLCSAEDEYLSKTRKYIMLFRLRLRLDTLMAFLLLSCDLFCFISRCTLTLF